VSGSSFLHERASTVALPLSAPQSPYQFHVTSQSYLGYVQFTVSYDTSGTAIVGANLTVSAVVSVDNLTESEDYVRDYVMVATLLCDDHSVNTSVGSPEPIQRFLYQGAEWGPLEFSIPLTEADTGLSPGQSANASVTLNLITDVYYDSPGYRLSGYSPIFGDGSAFVVVSDPGTAQASTVGGEGGIGRGAPALLLPSILVGTGVFLLIVRIAAFRGKPEGDGRPD
jgi:hypothetical protein